MIITISNILRNIYTTKTFEIVYENMIEGRSVSSDICHLVDIVLMVILIVWYTEKDNPWNISADKARFTTK